MSPEDRRLAALLAAFVPERAAELATLIGGVPGDDVRAATAALLGAGRCARLAELARALAASDGTSVDAVERDARTESGGNRLRERMHLELRCAQSRS